MKHKSSFLLPACVLALLAISPAANASTQGLALPLAIALPHFLESVMASVVFGLVGIVLAVVGFKLFDLVTPFNLEKEMCENKNVAVGILCAAIVLGICHIIAASMS